VVDSICLATRYRYFIKFQPHSPVNFLGYTRQIGQTNAIELASFSLHLLVYKMPAMSTAVGLYNLQFIEQLIQKKYEQGEKLSFLVFIISTTEIFT